MVKRCERNPRPLLPPSPFSKERSERLHVPPAALLASFNAPPANWFAWASTMEGGGGGGGGAAAAFEPCAAVRCPFPLAGSYSRWGRLVLPNRGPPSLQPMVGEIGSAARGEAWIPFSTSCHAFSCSWVASFLAGRGLQLLLLLLLGLEAGEAIGVSTEGAFGEADRERGRGRGRGRRQ